MTDNQSVGATMNWQNKVVELNGSVNGDFNQQSNESRSNSQNFEIRNSAYTNSHNWSSGNNKNFGFQYKVEWKPDSTWNILFRPEFSYGKNHNNNDNESAAFNDDPYLYSKDPLADYEKFAKEIGVNHRRGSSVSSSHNINASASLQVNKQLGKRGRNITLNVRGGYGDSKGESANYSLTDYYQILAHDGGDSVYHKVQYNNNPQKNYNMTIVMGTAKGGRNVKINGTQTTVSGTENVEGKYYELDPIAITANTEYVLTKGSAEGLVMLIILEPTE